MLDQIALCASLVVQQFDNRFEPSG